ncbi:YihY/virulence factor BrkB family protein [Bacillaceae bacterium S4-13-58]
MVKQSIDFTKELFRRFTQHEIPALAAQLSYFLLLSLFPFLVFLITLLGYLPINQESLFGLIDQFAPPQTLELIDENLGELLNNQNTGLLSIGIVGTLWSASNGINALIRSFNHAYDVGENRSFIVARLVAIVLTIAMILVIAIALLLPVFGKTIGVFLFSFVGLSEGFLRVWNTLRWVISTIILLIVLTALYVIAPNNHINIKEVLVGATFATIGWQIVSLAFAYYIDHFSNFSATYGSLGGVIILMIWFYLSGMIIIIGGELNAMIKEYRKNGTYTPVG